MTYADPGFRMMPPLLRTLSLTMTIPSIPRDSERDDGPKEPEEPKEPQTWYGWQLIALDALALTLATFSLSNGSPGSLSILVVGAAALYLLGAPALHLLHKQPWQAAGSLALRIGAPLLGAMMMDTGGYGATSVIGPFTGMLAGAALAPLVDYALLAFKPTKPSPDWVS